MDKEIGKDIVLYHLSRKEVDYLRSNGFARITLTYIPRPNGGRTVGTERNTPLGKQNERFLEGVMKKAGFEVNTLPNPTP